MPDADTLPVPERESMREIGEPLAMDVLRWFVTERERLVAEHDECHRKRLAGGLDGDWCERNFWRVHEELAARAIETHDELVRVALPFVMQRMRREQEARWQWANRLRGHLKGDGLRH